MDKNIFDQIEEKLENFKYNSLQYADYDDLKEYEVICDNDQLIAIYGYKDKFNLYEICWATNEANSLINFIKQLNKEVFVSFIPEQWMGLFKDNNFAEFSVFRDYWMNGLDDIPNCSEYIKLTIDECEEASSVTLSCKEQSRGFYGETAQWFEEWINNDTSTDSDYKDNCVLVHKEDNQIAGIVCVANYGHDSQKGTVAWIRELAKFY